MMRRLLTAAALAALGLAGAACQRQSAAPPAPPVPPPHDAEADFRHQLYEQLRTALPGTVILIPPGTHKLDQPLSVRADGVTLRGAGAERSTLSFGGKVAGLTVQAGHFTLDGVAFEDTSGDGVSITGGGEIVIHGVRVGWTRGPQDGNGAYGIHVQGAHNVLIEDSAGFGAATAGIGVLDSSKVIVRRCHLEQNVAGILVADVAGADLTDNIATGNSGGIVILNRPGASQRGLGVRVLGNKLYKNNLGNFATAGNMLARLPAGTGIVVNGADTVEISDNDIKDNQTANVLIAAFMFAAPEEPSTAVYPRAIYLYGNHFSGGGSAPLIDSLTALKAAHFASGRLPDVVWDGYRAGAAAATAGRSAASLCVDAATSVLDADAPHAYRSPSSRPAGVHCQLPKLSAVLLGGS
jgi:parallel beta-helix repeat protein